jgi:hypothetical protein
MFSRLESAVSLNHFKEEKKIRRKVDYSNMLSVCYGLLFPSQEEHANNI